MVKIITFDMWQTLADYSPELLKEILKETKLKMTLQDFILKKDQIVVSYDLNHRERFLERMKKLGVNDKSTLEKISSLYNEFHKKMFLYDDVIETLTILKNRKYILTVITNADRYGHEKIMKLFPENFFDCVIASFDVGFSKPEKEIFLEMSKKFDVDSDEIVMIGDNEINDIIPASNLGWKTVFINREGKTSDNADYNISSLKKLINIF